jgi:hypothetical protein
MEFYGNLRNIEECSRFLQLYYGNIEGFYGIIRKNIMDLLRIIWTYKDKVSILYKIL